jgi:hypothetical protein
VFGLDVEKALVVKVDSLSDLVRVAGSIVLSRNPMYIMRFRYNGQIIYTMLSVIRDYYKYYGVPMAYYYTIKDGGEEHKSKYILIKVDEMGEEIVLTDKIRHGYAVIPVLDLAEPPPFFPLEALGGES